MSTSATNIHTPFAGSTDAAISPAPKHKGAVHLLHRLILITSMYTMSKARMCDKRIAKRGCDWYN